MYIFSVLCKRFYLLKMDKGVITGIVTYVVLYLRFDSTRLALNVHELITCVMLYVSVLYVRECGR